MLPTSCHDPTRNNRAIKSYDATVPLTPDEFYENATSLTDEQQSRALFALAGWEPFPFEMEGLRVAELRPPQVPEAPRHDEDPASCRSCAASDGLAVWQNDAWRLIAMSEPSGAPLVLMLLPKGHFDLGNLPDDLAAQLGQIVVHVGRAVESLEHIARAHISRFGDGGAHLHIFIFARPEGFIQLRGNFFTVWDDLLAPVPRDVRDADAARVGELLAASFGGTASASSDSSI
jgi:diadenosine tetraphosphate (Ap4A) HIT family hydrolase